ncbi:ferritin-like domain-containing protein [Actinoplanes flavus]|uniref:Ferritin-like domain-containing protein n=1 Tax=Actinoplanes flavus TaxID=2820290 RepID=A0ABS3USC9_9ACTN|nr:ferritin-like domain-containing protein [Actinoplanes flavus]MBO3741477.1 ferritin-like domain-containing protein [Actinoplanes flavus]
MNLDLAGLAFDAGGRLLVRKTLAGLPPGSTVTVTGRDPFLTLHLRAWCRSAGHGTSTTPDGGVEVVTGRRDAHRWAQAERAGEPGTVTRRPPGHWGLAARGALLEAGGPDPAYDLSDRDVVWADLAPRLYAQAAASQWNPATAIPWDATFALPADIEAAVVQIMTYLVENEQAALVIPARLLTRVHPHFREVVGLLAVQAADEARHVDVFTRRALHTGGRMGSSSAGGRASLASLLAEPDFTLASFLLSVLGEGTFVHLLTFLDRHAPDPVTRAVTRLARADEARHVAFGVAHLEHQSASDPTMLGRLRAAVERRHDVLIDTAGLNQDVFDALLLLAAGEWTPEALGRGHLAVQRLQEDMDTGRRRHLSRLGFPDDEAAELSALHTRNFM